MDKLIETHNNKYFISTTRFNDNVIGLLDAVFQDGRRDHDGASEDIGKNYHNAFGEPVIMDSKIVEHYGKVPPYFGEVMTKTFINPAIFSDLRFCDGSDLSSAPAERIGDKNIVVFHFDDEN
jgi:hypothetical protein